MARRARDIWAAKEELKKLGEDLPSGTRMLLEISLSAAVPLWIEELKARGWKHVLERARVCAQAVAEKGDIIQFKSKKRGETADAFNRLAEGIACLSFSPGGVWAFGMHFEAKQIRRKARYF